MSVKPVVMIGNDLLGKTSHEVDFTSGTVERLINDLRETLHYLQEKKQIGRAIAAPQIGCLKKIIYMEIPDRTIVMINPVIKDHSRDTFEVWDSCYSADVAFFGKTIRYKEITVDYLDENNGEITETFRGDLSELFQHEIDHLEGIVFTDRIVDNNIIMRSEWEKLEG